MYYWLISSKRKFLIVYFEDSILLLPQDKVGLPDIAIWNQSQNISNPNDQIIVIDSGSNFAAEVNVLFIFAVLVFSKPIWEKTARLLVQSNDIY